ncbi:hypothetical protein THARTR1_05869 [Trichoderma harzianum]|uniref:Uncharacterized protein n=1 Tax=Trichoderma harzianum TaxID=5544 RepID=A0A2K0U7J4_TRIHA|nr:hypothetical protein THARTR1_05869 [Trichoderma harzianum]
MAKLSTSDERQDQFELKVKLLSLTKALLMIGGHQSQLTAKCEPSSAAIQCRP